MRCSTLGFIAVAAVSALLLLPGDASARNGGGFGGRGFGGGHGFAGGMRGAGIGGFRGAGIGGIRAAGFGRGVAAPMRGYRVGTMGWRGGPAWAGRRVAWGGAGWAGRRVAWGGQRWAGYGRNGWRHYGWRRGWGWWGYPVGIGLAYAAATSYYDDPCLRWDGWQWVNVCYDYGYGYPYGYSPY